jgi:hypothetical protein
VEGFFKYFRKLDAQHPKEFTAAMIRVLCDYPEQIVFRATDPAGELVKKHKYVPAISDVADFCEKEMKPWRELELRDQLAEKRRAETAAILSSSQKENTTLEYRQQVIGDIMAKIAITNILPPDDEDARRMPPGPERQRVMAHHEAKLTALAALPVPKLSKEALRTMYFNADGSRTGFRPIPDEFKPPNEFDDVDF